MNFGHNKKNALQFIKVFGLNFDEFRAQIRELWKDECFREAVEQRIRAASGVESACTQLIKEMATEAEG